MIQACTYPAFLIFGLTRQITCLTFPQPPFQFPTSIQQIFPLWDSVQSKISEQFISTPPAKSKNSRSFAEGNIPFITRQNIWRPREIPPPAANQTTLYDPLHDDSPPGIQYPVWYAFAKIQGSQEKLRHFLRLARVKNVWPLLAASITGGWVIHPTIPQSIRHIRSPQFVIAVINILFVMSASMIINDLYDIPLDTINNPHRPLVSGKITIPEAKWAAGIILVLSELLVIRFLPIHAQFGNHLSILGILLYTPFLKRMFVIKNIFCAALIAYSLIFAGLANAAVATLESKNRWLFMIMFSVIFTSSFQKEVLLDISDYEGDKANNIPTIATKYGRYNAFMIIYAGFTASIFAHSWALLGLYGPIGIIFPYIMNPLLMALPMIYTDQYSQRSIRKYDQFSTKILALCLCHFAILSKWPAVL